MLSGQCCQRLHCRWRPDWRPWRPLAALPAWRPCVAALAGLLPAFPAPLPASGGLAAGRDCLACGLGGLTVPWRPLAASALAALASFLAGWRRLAASAGGLGGLGGLLAALTTLLWRALQPIYFSFPGGLGGRRAGGLGVLPDGLAALGGLGWRPRRPRRPWPPTAVDALASLLQPRQFSCQSVITSSASRASSQVPIAQFLTSERVHRHTHTHPETAVVIYHSSLDHSHTYPLAPSKRS